MMRFNVTWRLDQKQKLVRIWLAASDRRAVSRSADRIEELLADNPVFSGTEFYGDLMLAVPPIGVIYKISIEDRIVEVVYVWHKDQIEQ
jgi:hypothetical protein